MPVSKISIVGCSESNDGGSRWIGQRSASAASSSPWSIGLAEHVPEPAERLLADRDGDRRAGVDHVDAARDAVRRVHRDRADAVVAEVLLHLCDQVDQPLSSGSAIRSAV